MSKYPIESFYRGILTESITAARTVPFTVGVSNVPVLTEGFLTFSPNTTDEEIMYYSSRDSALSTVTISKRGISPVALDLTTAGVDYDVTAYQKKHSPLDIVSADINNVHLNSNPSTGGTNTWTGANTFSGTVTFSGTAIFTKIMQIPVFADVTARNTAIPSPVAGDTCVVTGVGYQYYSGGTWNTLGVGSPTPNGDETTSGSFEGATLAEMATATDVGGTGAHLTVMNKNLKKTSAGAGDENKVPVLDANGAVNAFVNINTLGTLVTESGMTINSLMPFYEATNKRLTVGDFRDFVAVEGILGATQAETDAGTNDFRYVTPSKLAANLVAKTASQAEYRAGASTTKFLTPNSVAFEGAVVRNDATVTLTATSTAFPFTGEDFDTNSFHDNVTNNQRLTVPTAGKYRFNFNGYITSNASATDVNAYYLLRKNGTTTMRIWQDTVFPTGTGSKSTPVNVTAILQLSANDYVEFMVQKDTTGSVISMNANGTSGYATTASVERLGN